MKGNTMRISRQDIQTRESIVLSFFTDNPTATLKAANDVLKAQTGKSMDTRRLSKLRASVTKPPEAAPAPVTQAEIEAGKQLVAALTEEAAIPATIAATEPIPVTEGPVTTVGELAQS